MQNNDLSICQWIGQTWLPCFWQSMFKMHQVCSQFILYQELLTNSMNTDSFIMVAWIELVPCCKQCWQKPSVTLKLFRAAFCSCSLSSLPPPLRLVHWFLETCYIQHLCLFVCVPLPLDTSLGPSLPSFLLPVFFFFFCLLTIFVINGRGFEDGLSGRVSVKCSVEAMYMGIHLNLFHHAVKHAWN